MKTSIIVVIISIIITTVSATAKAQGTETVYSDDSMFFEKLDYLNQKGEEIFCKYDSLANEQLSVKKTTDSCYEIMLNLYSQMGKIVEDFKTFETAFKTNKKVLRTLDDYQAKYVKKCSDFENLKTKLSGLFTLFTAKKKEFYELQNNLALLNAREFVKERDDELFKKEAERRGIFLTGSVTCK